jgi:hypothetical protein
VQVAVAAEIDGDFVSTATSTVALTVPLLVAATTVSVVAGLSIPPAGFHVPP